MWKRTYSLAAGAALLAFGLAGCGGGGNQTAGPSSGDETSAAVPRETDASFLGAAGDETDDASVGGDSLEVVPLGQPQENGPGTMTVKAVKCGATKLEHAKENEAWYDDPDGQPETLPLKAKPGMVFCVVQGSYKVTGKKPVVGWDDFDNLVTADGTEYAADEASEAATMYLNRHLSGCSPFTCETLNPGTTLDEIVKVYQVPKGTKPVGVNWPMSTIDSGPVYQFAASAAAGQKTSAPGSTKGPTGFDEGLTDEENAASGGAVSARSVEQQITEAIAKAGGAADDVKCEHGLRGKVGATVTCTVGITDMSSGSAEESKQRVTAKVTRVEGGKAYFDILPAS